MPPKKEQEDPEELQRRKFRAKCQFRALGRLVMANTYWLIEGIDEYTGVDDVKRRVEQAKQTKAKPTAGKQLLTLKDKALLNKKACDRTLEEKQLIYRKLGGLKCFKKYPNHVKRKLAEVTYFRYYGPNRVIMRQYQEAQAMYFIVTGEVIQTNLIYDELLKENVSVITRKFVAGDVFGEVSLLHGIPRMSTCTSSGHCELLTLLKPDFKYVLQATMQAQWDEVKAAMSAFTYFDSLDDMARLEGCIAAKLKSYEANETLLGDGEGVANHVYFILSGRCQMIESLRILVTTRLGRNHYALYDPHENLQVADKETELDLDKKWFNAYKTKLSDLEQGTVSILRRVPEENSLIKNVGQVESSSSDSASHDDSNENSNAGVISKDLLVPHSQHAHLRQSVRISVSPAIHGTLRKKTPTNLRTYFMQVVLFNAGSTFGFGENMRDRRIIALTPVKCMLLPKVWLLQRNTANIWTRIQHYLGKKIPTKKKLFKEFVSARRWEEYRNQVVSDVVGRSNTVNFTSIHDVPYSVRMEDMLDL